MTPIRTALAGLLVLSLAGCSQDAPTAPSGTSRTLDAQRGGATKFWESGASLAWNAVARSMTTTHRVSQQFGTRSLAYLSLAQYDAVASAHAATPDHPSYAGAAAGASVAILSWAYPDSATYFEKLLAAEAAAPRWPGEQARDWDAGVALGRSVGAAVIASAKADHFDLVWTGAVPVCPACWYSLIGRPPVFPRLGEMRTFFLTSGSEFRPGPPPALGSPAFLSAMAELRHFSDTRTHEQDSIAKFWAAPAGFAFTAAAYNNEVAADAIVRYRLDEASAAHALALMNMASMDAFIACHDAKYTYWLLRPPEADPGISVAIPVPNHPSYPSNHACVTGAGMAILAELFPADAARFTGLADQAAISRLYAGIHYRFDADTGLSIARHVAAVALEADVHGLDAFALN